MIIEIDTFYIFKLSKTTEIKILDKIDFDTRKLLF